MKEMHVCAWAGNEPRLRTMLSNGRDVCLIEDPHTGWPSNVSLMYWAAWAGYVPVAKLLIEYGIDLDIPIKGNGERGYLALHEALAPSPWGDLPGVERRWSIGEPSTAGKLKVAQVMLDAGAYYDVYAACARDDLARVEVIFQEESSRVDASSGHEFGMTPLHWAARVGAVDCARFLVEHGADVNQENQARRTPLPLAAEHDQTDMIRFLVEMGADINTEDPKGRTPLHRATYEGKPQAAETLLELGADPSITNKNGKTAFQIARKEAKYFKQMT